MIRPKTCNSLKYNVNRQIMPQVAKKMAVKLKAVAPNIPRPLKIMAKMHKTGGSENAA
jgi:hypothetical protein